MNKYVIANWKENMNLLDVRRWLREFSVLLNEKKFKVSVVISPPFVYLHEVYEFAKKLNISIAAQDVSIYESGAHTGEIGAFQISDYCKYCIIGHSERGESEGEVAAKLVNCVNFGITPIVCFTDPDHFASGAIAVVEDPESISKNGIYNPKDIGSVVLAIKNIKSRLNAKTVVLYGGSVNRQNADLLADLPELNGVLVGNASLNPQHFYEIVEAFEKHAK